MVRTPQNAAGLWAAKEAISKALGSGIGELLRFHEIEISKDGRGAPSFTLLGGAAERFPLLSSSLSIAHDGGFAIAVAVLELAYPPPTKVRNSILSPSLGR